MNLLQKIRGKRARVQAPIKAQQRARVMSDGDLLRWAENTMYAVGRSLSEQSKSQDYDEAVAYIDNAVAETEVLHALVSEIQRRLKAPVDTGGGLYG